MKWRIITYEDFIKSYNGAIIFSWSLSSIVRKITWTYNDLPFLPERMKIEKVEKLVSYLHDKTEYVIHLRNLRQALNHELVFKMFREWLNLIKMLG